MGVKKITSERVANLRVAVGEHLFIHLLKLDAFRRPVDVAGAVYSLTIRLPNGTIIVNHRIGTPLTPTTDGVTEFEVAPSETSALAAGTLLLMDAWDDEAVVQLVPRSTIRLIVSEHGPDDQPSSCNPTAIVAYGLPAPDSVPVGSILAKVGEPKVLGWAPQPPTPVRRVITQPDDGSDFFVELPVPMADGNYAVTWGQSSTLDDVVSIICPAADRVGARFRVVTNQQLSTGATIDFFVQHF